MSLGKTFLSTTLVSEYAKRCLQSTHEEPAVVADYATIAGLAQHEDSIAFTVSSTNS